MDTLIGGYVLESELGHGATGTVYLGRSASDQVVAVKVLAPALASDSSFQTRFASEAAVMTRLADPHCVAVYGHGTDSGRSWIAMEYVPGSTLRAVLETAGVLTPAQACGVMLGALAGLGRAHEIGLVHRDFKPENVLVATDGNSKLTDFGLTIDRGSDTSFRALEGSPAYMSPEQVRAEPAGARSDIYAAGAVLYELVAGRAPYTGSTPLAVMRAHVDAPLPDTTALPPRIGQLVRSALAKDPADRPAGAAEFAAQLRDAADRDLGPGWLAAASIAGIVAGIVGAHTSAAIGGPDHSPSSRATPRRARTLRVGSHAIRPAVAGLTAAGVTVAVVVGAVVASAGSSHPAHRATRAVFAACSPAKLTAQIASSPRLRGMRPNTLTTENAKFAGANPTWASFGMRATTASGDSLTPGLGVADCEHGTWTLRDTSPEFVGCGVVPKALHAQLGITCTPFGTSTTGPTSDGDPGASNPPCTPQPCAVGSDGVAVSLSQIRHVTSANGKPVLEFDLRVVNGSPWELGIGPEAYVQLVLSDGSKVDMGPDDGPQALGRPECYGNPFMSGTDTEIYHLQPGESLTIPKPLCFALDPNQAPVESVSVNDENGPGPEVVKIAGIR